MYNLVQISNNINGENMKVSDAMNKNLIICNYSINVVNICKLMSEYNIGFIPIEKNKKIIGVVTDRDIVINMISNKISYNCSIEKYINRNVINIESASSIENALNVMKKNKVKRLIVTDKSKVIGIISLSDIIFVNNEDKIIDTIKSIWSIENNTIEYKTEIDEFYL